MKLKDAVEKIEMKCKRNLFDILRDQNIPA
jgi:hypothetical protein